MGRYICFGLDVYILCAIKAGRAAGADTVCAKDLNGFLFQNFIADKVVEVVGSKVCDSAAVRQFGFRSCGPWYRSVLAKTSQLLDVSFILPNDHRPFLILCFFKGRLRHYERLRCPFINELVNLLSRCQQYANGGRDTTSLFCQCHV